MRRAAAFTLLEIILSVAIILIIILVAVPGVQGVLADQHRRQSFEKFDDFVQNARALSRREQRAYLLSWEQDLGSGFQGTTIVLKPEGTPGKENARDGLRIAAGKDETFDLELPAALTPVSRKAWMFWPSGTCEPAIITFKSPAGHWVARYDGLTGRAEFSTE